MANDPGDPITNLAAGVAQAHELFLTLVKGGFTEGQALYLVGQMLAATQRP